MRNILTITLAAIMLCSCGSSAKTNLYKWEKDEVRLIADAAICYGGHSARNPYL